MRFIFYILLVFLTISCSSSSNFGVPSGEPKILGEAPNFILNDLHGGTVSLKQFRGHPVLIHFWASWCAQCTHELPVFERIYQKYKAQGLIVFSVVVDDSKEDLLDYLKARPYSFVIATDEDEKAKFLYEITALPSTVLVDKDGNLRPLLDPDSDVLVNPVVGPRNWATASGLKYIEKFLH